VQGDEEAGAARYRVDVTAGTHADPAWSVAVIDTALGSLVWEDAAGPGREEIDAMVARMPAAIGEYGGLIPRRAVEESVDSTGGLAAHATLQFFRHTESQSIEQLLDAIVALDAAVAEIDDNVLLLAYAAVAKAELVLSGGAAAEPALSGADAHVSRARDIDASHPAPVLAQAMVSLARERPADAAAGVRSILVQPALDPSLGFAGGVILAAAGEVDEGTALVRAFDHSHAASAGYQHVFLTIERLQSRDTDGAMAHAALIPLVAEIRPLLHAVVLDAIDKRLHALAVLERLPSRDLVRVDHWAAVLARSWEIPPSWRDALIARVTDLLSPAAG
jgi:ABC-type transporter Mla MlaB component